MRLIEKILANKRSVRLSTAPTAETGLELARQFERRTVAKRYQAVVVGEPDRDSDFIEQPLGKHPTVRTQMAVWFGPGVREWRHLRTYRIPHAQPGQEPGVLVAEHVEDDIEAMIDDHCFPINSYGSGKNYFSPISSGNR